MIKLLEIEQSEKEKYINNDIMELPTIITTSLHFMGIRYDDLSILLVFELVAEETIFEFNVCLSCDNITDLNNIKSVNNEWIINDMYIPTDSRSVQNFYMAESAITTKDSNDVYIIHGRGKNKANIILTYNYYYMIEYVIYSLKSCREIKKDILEKFHTLMERIYCKEDYSNLNIEKIYIPKYPSRKEILAPILVVFNITNKHIIFTANILRSSLNKSIFKQEIISRDLDALDKIYEESCLSDDYNYYISSTKTMMPIEYKLIDEKEKIAREFLDVGLLTEADDFHKLSIIIIDKKFITLLEEKVYKYIKSKLY